MNGTNQPGPMRAKVVDLWNANATFTTIANQLGISRGAVSRHVMTARAAGLITRASNVRVKQPKPQKGGIAAKQAVSQVGRNRDDRGIATLGIYSMDRSIGFTGPRARTCQWIGKDPRVDPAKCGAAVQPMSSYCPEHHRRCWQPRKIEVRPR